MRILVCGGRDFDSSKVWIWLEHVMKAELGFYAGASIDCIIHGGATGADSTAGRWAESEGIKVHSFPVRKEDWKKYGKNAGPMRNRKMIIEGKPDVVIAFPGGKETESMINLADEYGIRVVRAE